MLEVQVVDRGPGMNKEEILNVLDLADSSSGLQRPKTGLHICKKICENLGGEMTVMSRPKETRFRFTIKVMHANNYDLPREENEEVSASHINLSS